MIVVKLNGGLGNQMFQYACGRAVARRTRQPLKLDLSQCRTIDPKHTREYELNVFNTIQAKASASEIKQLKGLSGFLERVSQSRFKKYLPLPLQYKSTYFKERAYHFDPEVLSVSGSVYLDGYWQSPKYFSDYEAELRQEFTLATALSQTGQRYLLQFHESNAVSLHIRRGDYVTNQAALTTHGICSLVYYAKAIEIIKAQVDSPHFFIFSDDLIWVKQHFPLLNLNYTLIEKTAGGFEDMWLMSQCRHHIIANSTFSWWGAWLNASQNKLVIIPAQWFANFPANTEDLYPETWIRI